MKIAVVDLETTGFMPKGLIVEVGIVELDLETGERTVLYDELVKEEGFGEKHKDSWIFENSGLSYEKVMEAKPLDIETIQKIFDKYSVTAYNKKFDFGFLNDRGLKFKELVCPMIIATDVCKIKNKWGKNKWPKVQEAYDFFFPDTGYVESHRGCDDALHEAEIVYALYKMGKFQV